jgi:hypothetical protein
MTVPQGKTCSRCRYELTGLSDRGHCPECGQYFDVFSGEGFASREGESYRRSERLLNRMRTLALAGVAVIALVIGALVSLVAVHPARPIWIGLAVALLFTLAAVTSFIYEKPN